MGYISEFKAFAVKGNAFDLAVGVVIGAAFGKIINSLVDDIITPAVLSPALKAANLSDIAELIVPGTGIKYGKFLSTAISFLLIAIVLFLIVNAFNRMRKKEEKAPASPPPPTASEKLLMEIRDSLKK